jgi:hypothetical protein
MLGKKILTGVNAGRIFRFYFIFLILCDIWILFEHAPQEIYFPRKIGRDIKGLPARNLFLKGIANSVPLTFLKDLHLKTNHRNHQIPADFLCMTRKALDSEYQKR